VALRILCSQDWLTQQVDNESDTITFETTHLSETAFQHFHLYEDAVYLLKYSEKFHPRKFDVAPFNVLCSIFEKYKNRYGLPTSSDRQTQTVQAQILKHIEGIIIGPTIVHLGMSGMFYKYFMEASFKAEEFHADPESFDKLLQIFSHLGWFNEKSGTYQFTETGLFYAKRASAYGVTVSYIPTFRKLDELIFGNPKTLQPTGQSGNETHVDREMNVWGSGGAHSGYFKVVDEIIIEIFNRPITEQPKGILDMGCGNGAFIQHLFDVIDQQTLRGKMLDEYPLILVGSDYNEVALNISKANLIQADIWAKIVWGDIGRPDLLASDLQSNYGVDLSELLNVRTFLDHNRIWEVPKIQTNLPTSESSGAYVYRGTRINNNLIEQSLLEHFQKWEPHVSKFGLLVIELHTILHEIASKGIAKTAVTAYDATHGYSDQYSWKWTFSTRYWFAPGFILMKRCTESSRILIWPLSRSTCLKQRNSCCRT